MALPSDSGRGRRRQRTASAGFAAPFTPGTIFADRFRIDSIVGAGGMGSVYHAIDMHTDEQIALKVLKKERIPDPEARQRFEREAKILATLDDPGIVSVRAFGYSEDGAPWFSMELLRGETLRERVAREGVQQPDAMVPIVRAACSALQAAHAAGIVHRDLKPDNIFLMNEGPSPIKLLDFGLSLLAGGKKLTQTGTVIGTPRYMSPEQIASAHRSDGRADVYALGVIVYEALTGASPFVASDQGQLLGAILQGRTEPLTRVRPDLSPDVERCVERAMASSVDDRFSEPGEFARAFSAAALQTESSSPRFSVAPEAPHTSSRSQPQREAIWAVPAIVAGAISVAAFGAWLAYLLLRP